MFTILHWGRVMFSILHGGMVSILPSDKRGDIAPTVSLHRFLFAVCVSSVSAKAAEMSIFFCAGKRDFMES